jgi:hypothetical protein
VLRIRNAELLLVLGNQKRPEDNDSELTEGAPNPDFADAGGDTCSGPFNPADTCLVNVNFTPK